MNYLGFSLKTFVLLFYGSKVKNRFKNHFSPIRWRGISLLKALHNLEQFVKDFNNGFLVFILFDIVFFNLLSFVSIFYLAVEHMKFHWFFNPVIAQPKKKKFNQFQAILSIKREDPIDFKMNNLSCVVMFILVQIKLLEPRSFSSIDWNLTLTARWTSFCRRLLLWGGCRRRCRSILETRSGSRSSDTSPCPSRAAQVPWVWHKIENFKI